MAAASARRDKSSGDRLLRRDQHRRPEGLAKILPRHVPHLLERDRVDFRRALRVVLGAESIQLVHRDNMGEGFE